MRLGTHFVCACLLVLSVLSRVPFNFLSIILFLLGSVMPDLLEMLFGFRHRSKIVHNYAVLIPLVFLSALSTDFLAVALGYLHHLVLDSLTRQGVYVFCRKVKWYLESLNPWHNLVIILAHLALGLLIVFWH